MRFFSATNFMLVSLLALTLMPGEERVAEGFHLSLLLLLPALLLKIGLAAPIVLAVLAKLLLLLGLKKKKAILLPTLLSGSSSDDSSGESTSYDSNLGRIKRSVDFVQQIVGQTEVSEEQLLESILKVDTLRCGEKLLCEIAFSASAARRNEALDEDEAAMINIFAERDAARASEIGPALKVYRDALMDGIRKKDCARKFPTCPFTRSEMMQLVHLVTGPDFSIQVPVPESKPETVRKPTFNKKQEQAKILKKSNI